jgi:hypothetical protein
MKRAVPSPIPEYLGFLAPYDSRIRELALATREVVLREAPGASELIYDAYNAVASGYTFTRRPGDAFQHVAVYRGWVNLGFNFGATLDDPGGLLQGTGSRVRHIRISEAADLARPGVLRLIRAAVAAARRDGKPAGGERSYVRAIYPRKRRGSRASTGQG